MSQGLAMFEARFGPPPYSERPIDPDWRPFEEWVGVQLPDWYKEFVSGYGPCRINDTLLVFHPAAPRDGGSLNLYQEVEQVADAYARRRAEGSYPIPHPIHPEPGGCLPVARTTGGYSVFLLPPNDRLPKWSVVADVGAWLLFPGRFTTFVNNAARGTLYTPQLEGTEASFELVGTLP